MEAEAACRLSIDRDARTRVPQEEEHIQLGLRLSCLRDRAGLPV